MRYLSVCSGVEAASLAWEYLGWEPVAFCEVEPFPCAVLAARWPNVPNLGDLTTIKILENGDIQYGTDDSTRIIRNDGLPIDLCVGGAPCFVAGTMVLTPSGYVPIETLKVGDAVINADGEEDVVTATGNREAEIGELKIYGRSPIYCTAEHPFLSIGVKRDYRRKSATYAHKISVGEYEFLEASQTVGRYVARLPIPSARQDDIPDNDTGIPDAELLELAGWYVGDGYIRRHKGKNKKQVSIALVSKHKIKTFEAMFKDVIHYSTCEGKMVISKTKLADWLLKHFGEHADGKRIPYWLYNHAHKERFLHGYEMTDGHYESQTKTSICTVSKALAYGYADLCGNGSVASHVPPKTRMLLGRVVNQKKQYLASHIKDNPRVKIIRGRYASIARSWRTHGTTGTVYNIRVGNSHTYIVEGIAVHNCQSFSVAGKREGLAGKSGLIIDYIQRLYELAAYRGLRWAIYENVPGMLSSGGGNDFAVILSGFTGRDVAVPDGGWGNAGVVANATDGNFGVAYRILDAQYTRVDGFPKAVPQRRRRVFLIGYLGDWKRAAEVLLEPSRLLGHTPPQRKAQQTVAESAQGRAGGAVAGREVCQRGGRGGVEEKEMVLDMQGGKGGCHVSTDGASPTLATTHGDAHAILDNADGFNFELFSGECKNVSPCIGATRASDTMVYNDESKWWNGMDIADTLTCKSDVQRMPDKGHLQCIVDMPDKYKENNGENGGIRQ